MRTLRIVVTNRCNLNCSYCYNEGNEKHGSKNKEEIDLSIVAYVLKELRTELSEVVLTGGEPLLYSNIAELFVLLNDLKYPFRITTNGIELEKLFKMKEYQYVNKINISLDKFLPEEFRNGTKTSEQQYYKVIRNIKQLLDDKKEVGLNVIVTNKITVDEIEHFITEAMRIGIRAIKFLPLIGEEETQTFRIVREAMEKKFYEVEFCDNNLEIETYKHEDMVIKIVHQYCNQVNCTACKRNSFYRLNFDGSISSCLQHRYKKLDIKRIILENGNLLQCYKQFEKENMRE